MKRMGTKLSMTTAYNPRSNGQSERTNQTVEVVLRTMLADHDSYGKGHAEWDQLLGDAEFAINTSVSRSTGTTPFNMLYGVSPPAELAALPYEGNDGVEPDEAAQVFVNRRNEARQEARELLHLAQARMAKYFDNNHSLPQVGTQVWLRLVCTAQKGYRLQHGSKLDVVKQGSFSVLRKVGKLAFELELPDQMKIHPMISVAHLEPADPGPYSRKQMPLAQLVDGNEERFIIDRILAKKCRKTPGSKKMSIFYKVRWERLRTRRRSMNPGRTAPRGRPSPDRGLRKKGIQTEAEHTYEVAMRIVMQTHVDQADLR